MELSGRKVLVTGGAGFIGSHLVDKLTELGCYITVLDDFSNGRQENLVKALEKGNVRIIRGSVEDAQTVHHLVTEAEVIFHQAALNLLRSLENPVHDLAVNTTGTLNILTAMQQSPGKPVMVFASTGSVYGEPQYNPQDEDHPLCPVSPYGASKMAAERYVLLWNRLFGVNTTALRYYNVYGPRQSYDPKGGVMGIFIDRVLHGQPPVIEGKGKQERCFTFVDDVVRANLAAATTPQASGKVCNIGTTEVTTVEELAETVLELCNSKLRPVYSAARPGDVAVFRPDISRANAVLGYRPTVSLHEGVKKTISWFVESGLAPSPPGYSEW